jgi:hypothetical protein
MISVGEVVGSVAGLVATAVDIAGAHAASNWAVTNMNTAKVKSFGFKSFMVSISFWGTVPLIINALWNE